MNTVSLGDLFEFARKTEHPATRGISGGAYPFFISSQDKILTTDSPDQEGPALIIGDGGSASIHCVDGPFSASNHCYIAVPKSRLVEEAKFYNHYLKSNIHLLEAGFKGVGLRNVSKSYLSSLPLPTASDAAKRRVVEMLDRAEGICRKQEQVFTMINEIPKSIFFEMFGNPYSNSKKLPVIPIKDMGEVITGNTPPRKDTVNYGPGIEWIKSDNISMSHHILTRAEKTLSDKGKRIGRMVPAGSTLVTCIAGSPSSIGNAAFANREVAFNQQINAVIPHHKVDPYFLYCLFLVGKKLIQHASTNSMKGMVSKGKFQEIQFLSPPFQQQQKFGCIFKQVLYISQKLQIELTRSRALYESLSQYVFNMNNGVNSCG